METAGPVARDKRTRRSGISKKVALEGMDGKSLLQTDFIFVEENIAFILRR